MTNKEMRERTMAAAGINTGKYFSIQLPKGLKPGSTLNIVIDDSGNPVVNAGHDEVAEEIYANGYVKNTKLHRRWVMAQMFRMINYKGKYWSGYSECLRENYAYMYQFKMMVEEIRVLSKLEVSDREAFEERVHFFNKDVVIATCEDYIQKLQDYVDGLKIRKCKGIPYVRIKSRNVFYEDLRSKVYYPLEYRLQQIKRSKNYSGLYGALSFFMGDMIDLPCETPKCKEWIDAFKGAGSYYTLMNMVKFHDCFIVDQYTAEVLYGVDAVNYLNSMLGAYKGEYYRMFALLKATIEDNNFDFAKRMEEIGN